MELHHRPLIGTGIADNASGKMNITIGPARSEAKLTILERKSFNPA